MGRSDSRSQNRGHGDRSYKIFVEQGFLPNDTDATLDEFDAEEMLESLREHADEKILNFDCECIENDDDYAGLFMGYAALAGVSHEVAQIESTLDHENDKAVLSFIANGVAYQSEWKQDSDWVASDFFEFVDNAFAEQFDKRFVQLPAQDQCAEVLCLDKESGDQVAPAFERLAGSVSEDEITDTQILLVLVVSVVWFVITSIIGWFAGAFWMTAGIGLVAWAAFAIWRAGRIVAEKEAQEELIQQMQDDPRLIGKMAQEFVKSFQKA